MARLPEPLFHEEQKFQPRSRVLTAIPPAAMSLLMIWQVALGHKWGKIPMSNGSVIGWTIFLWIVYLRLMTVKLVTDVRAGEIRVTMKGLWRGSRIMLSGLRSAEPATFDPVKDWGGYGMRITKRGRAYLASGSEGVRLNLAGGATVLIGSRRAGELARAIRAAKP